MSNERYFTNPVSEFIWEDKYKAADDKNINDTWLRVAKILASNEEKDQSTWQKRFLWALKDFKVLPGGRVIANAGANKEKASTLTNCFVLPTINDSMSAIMIDGAANIALTLKSGGGIGYNISHLRPGGEDVKGINQGQASGPVSFLSIYDEVCKKVKAGNRRGAQIAVLNVSHPDIEKFIICKDGTDYLSSMNLSVAITDKFMHAVENDLDFDLEFKGKIYQTVKAKELFEKIIRHTYEYSEPGVIFIDTINKMNNLYYCENIEASNPCLVANSKILMANGSIKDIKNIKEKDLIQTDNIETKQIEFDEVVFSAKTKENTEIIEIELEDGKKLELTPDHKVYTQNRGYIEAQNLTEFDEIIVINP